MDDNVGSHWVGLIIKSDYALYSDSFGILPPLEVEQVCKGKKLYYNKKQIQSLKATSCGYYCVAFLLYSHDVKAFNRFLETFVNYTDINDTILKQLLESKGLK